MGFTKLSLRKNDKNSKYILFYAEYLDEAWLSKVNEADETTSIVKQFRCKGKRDLDRLVEYVKDKGELINLASSGAAGNNLQLIEDRLSIKKNPVFQLRNIFKFGLLPRLRAA